MRAQPRPDYALVCPRRRRRAATARIAARPGTAKPFGWRNQSGQVTFPLGRGGWSNAQAAHYLPPPTTLRFAPGHPRPPPFWHTVAVDPKVILLGSRVFIPAYFGSTEPFAEATRQSAHQSVDWLRGLQGVAAELRDDDLEREYREVVGLSSRVEPSGQGERQLGTTGRRCRNRTRAQSGSLPLLTSSLDEDRGRTGGDEELLPRELRN